MLGEHHVEQLPVEALRSWLDFPEVEARLEIEIVGAGAVLEVEIDQASLDAAARPALSRASRSESRSWSRLTPPAAGRNV